MATLAAIILVPLVGFSLPLVLTAGGLLFGYLSERVGDRMSAHATAARETASRSGGMSPSSTR